MDFHRMIDYHIHSAVTVDAQSSEDACCQRAAALGLKEIAFTNHVMLGNPDYTMSPDAVRGHAQAIHACQKKYPRMNIRMGLEVDYLDAQDNQIDAIIHRYEDITGRPFDFVMGAVHYLRGIFFSSKIHAPALFNPQENRDIHKTNLEVEEIYLEYFSLVTKAVRSGLFDLIAHPDLIKKHTGIFSPPVPFENYRASVETLVAALVDTGVGIEVNTKGLTLKVGEAYPSIPFLNLYISEARLRGQEPIITLGSDSHHAENVGALLMDGANAIKEAGCHILTGFDQRALYPIQMD